MLRFTRRGALPRRKGSVAPVVGVLLVVLVGFGGIVLDLGRVAVVRTQLQNGADSAAMAGASALGTDNLIVSSPAQSGDITTARSRAQTFAQANTCDLNGSRAIVLDQNNDVTVGLLSNPGTLGQSLVTSGSAPFNSVQVQTWVNPSHGGNLGFLLAPVLGLRSTSVQASATATVQLFQVDTVQAIFGLNSPILPITMSYSDWQKMVNKQTGQDNYRYDPTTNSIVAGSDGLQEQQLYPGSNVTSSNNGLIEFGTGSRSNAVLSAQIVNGPTYDQMIAQWPPNGSPPWNANHQFNIGADPGWRATNFTDLATAAATGDPRLIPINDGTSPGNGANGTYTIVALAPVRIMYSLKGGDGTGYALVQPAVMVDPTVVASSTALATGTQGGVPVVRLSR
jgi:hypothetical protein